METLSYQYEYEINNWQWLRVLSASPHNACVIKNCELCYRTCEPFIYPYIIHLCQYGVIVAFSCFANLKSNSCDFIFRTRSQWCAIFSMLPTLLLHQLIFINLFKQFGQIKGFLWVSVSAAAGLGINLKVMCPPHRSIIIGRRDSEII